MVILGCSDKQDPASPNNSDDQFEENDKRSDAAPIDEDTVYDSLKVVANDDDWYAMSTSADSIFVACDFIHVNGDINLDIVDESGTILASSNSDTDNEEINHILNSLGTYYIRVYLSSGNDNTYTIWWDDIASEGT
jgi:hypothetical protein